MTMSVLAALIPSKTLLKSGVGVAASLWTLCDPGSSSLRQGLTANYGGSHALTAPAKSLVKLQQLNEFHIEGQAIIRLCMPEQKKGTAKPVMDRVPSAGRKLS
jgi:hypothetical protein